MAISTAQLEQMTERLQALKSYLARREQSPDAPMDMNDPAVEMAAACEFPLPGRLTGRTLAEEVDRKIANVDVLMARAREHEALPPEMRAAADQENTLMVEDYKDGGVADEADDAGDAGHAGHANGAEDQRP
ncbi:hypothetical protein [Noviherbaspirillum soli]|uniref:hypothetical protein n=1 Tax=Noviherbaspirillum soli TaxID=1064518 RepID=UPI00188D9ED3|nr:hypothetical protein [Noviherbaspirillum soli]